MESCWYIRCQMLVNRSAHLWRLLSHHHQLMHVSDWIAIIVSPCFPSCMKDSILDLRDGVKGFFMMARQKLADTVEVNVYFEK